MNMKTQPDTAVYRALFEMLDVARGSALDKDEGLLLALGWLAAARLVITERVPGVARFEDLLDSSKLRHLQAAGLPLEVCEKLNRSGSDGNLNSRLQLIVAELVDDHGSESWSVPDAVWWVRDRGRGAFSVSYEPDLCDLAVAHIHATSNMTVWVPFDPSGQFTVRLLRRGAHVWSAGPGHRSQTLTQLLLALEDSPSRQDRVYFDSAPPAARDGAPPLTHCLCAPPIGMKVPRVHEWRRWEKCLPPCRPFFVSPDELDRSEAWAVATMWPLVSEGAVFVTSPGLLFAQGQEMRLRQALTIGAEGNAVSSVISLPAGLLGYAGIATNLLTLNAYAKPTVCLIDVAGHDKDGRVINRFGDDIELQNISDLLDGTSVDPKLAYEANMEELRANDFSLMPPRYTRRVTELAGERVRLGNVVAATVRSPVASKELSSWPVWEIGIQMLDHWRPIDGDYERWMSISKRKAEDSLLRNGDVVVSIKGTVGKVGIVGDIPSSVGEVVADRLVPLQAPPAGAPRTRAAVPSASCVALRVDRARMLPEYLMLYLRSDDFKGQLEALRVGSAIAHITPAALLSAVMIPLPPLEEQASLSVKYGELCELEAEAERIRLQMESMRSALFSTPPR